MTDYSELVRKMRTCIGDKKCFEKECRYWSELGCMDGNICCDAADAIEALNRLVDLNTERCEGLREQLRKAQEQHEKHLNELEQQLPKRGKRVYNDGDYIPYCSVCGIPQDTETPYCYYCGAKMEVQE